MAKANPALARTCLCRGGRLVRPAREASVRPANSQNIISAAHCVLPHATPDEGSGATQNWATKNRHYTFTVAIRLILRQLSASPSLGFGHHCPPSRSMFARFPSARLNC
jgi:hypothetical protein